MSGSDEARRLVETVRETARRHAISWEALVPDTRTVDPSAEAAEEVAYADMALAKRALRDHICATYGISVGELNGLAMP